MPAFGYQPVTAKLICTQHSCKELTCGGFISHHCPLYKVFHLFQSTLEKTDFNSFIFCQPALEDHMLDGRASPSSPAFLACMLQMPITFFPLVPTPQSAIPCKRGAFIRRFTIIRQLVDFFLVIGRSVIKSIEISAKALSGINKSFSSSFFRSRQIVFFFFFFANCAIV
jgi:hypothetical protein